MNISLPEAMKSYVEEQVEKGDYGTASEYVRELVRRDQRERSQAKLEGMLLEGLNSGEAVPATESFWSGLRRDLKAQRRKRRV